MNETKPSGTKPKKVVSRNIAIALGIVCIILIAGIGGAMAYYTIQINNKDATARALYNDYASTHSHSDTDFNALYSTFNSLIAPKLVKVNLLAADTHPVLQQERLHVYGYLCNVGSNTAYNCTLHVVAYQSGGVVAIDTHIDLGNINGESYATVDANVYYQGISLASWSVTPEWTS